MLSAPTHQELIEQHVRILESLKYSSGLFAASKQNVGTGYDKAWLRDNFYECLAFYVLGDLETVRSTYRAILNIFLKHEFKIDYAIQSKPEHTHQYIHARFHPVTFEEYWEEWGNKQNDSIGCILFQIGRLEKDQKGSVLKSDNDRRIVQKLVWYLATLEYWQDDDSGMWEENQEVHASSIGACVAGLTMAKQIEGIEVREILIERGHEVLARLLPRESKHKFVDLALLSLIWPYNIVSDMQAEAILSNLEYHLLRDRGVIRYKGDRYYNANEDGWSEEAEWTFGLSWLAIIYAKRGNTEKADYFMEEAKKAITKEGTVPELFYSHTDTPNENNPLGWSESLFIIALNEMNRKGESG
jgi:phosphorylase kinase alpha/beta subunit